MRGKGLGEEWSDIIQGKGDAVRTRKPLTGGVDEQGWWNHGETGWLTYANRCSGHVNAT